MTIKSIKNTIVTIGEAISNPEEFFEEVALETEEHRMGHCVRCDLFSNGWCSSKKSVNGVSGCGCFLPLKMSKANQKCPLGHW